MANIQLAHVKRFLQTLPTADPETEDAAELAGLQDAMVESAVKNGGTLDGAALDGLREVFRSERAGAMIGALVTFAADPKHSRLASSEIGAKLLLGSPPANKEAEFVLARIKTEIATKAAQQAEAKKTAKHVFAAPEFKALAAALQHECGNDSWWKRYHSPAPTGVPFAENLYFTVNGWARLFAMKIHNQWRYEHWEPLTPAQVEALDAHALLADARDKLAQYAKTGKLDTFRPVIE